MYGNLYVSGLVGSDATSNPPPATPTATTRTHSQPQPHLPFSTVATAALQNNRDDPHLAGNEACLCSLCHIKDRFFPRSQDGRIVLPHPTTLSHSTRLHRPTASMTSATSPATSPLTTHRRNRTDITASNRDPKFNEGRRGAGTRTPQLQSDRAEGSNTGLGRIPTSANMGEYLPQRSFATDESLRTPQMDELESRPFSGPSRRTQKYEHKTKRKRPDPWPRILDSEEFSVESSQQSSSSQHASSRSRLDSFLDKHGTAQPRNLLKPPLARELSLQTTNLEAPGPSTPLTSPQTYIGAYGYEHRPILFPHHQGTFDASSSNYPEMPGRMETSQHHHDPRHHSLSRPESLTDVPQDRTRIIKFSSRSRYPQSSDNNPTPTTSGERSVNSSPTRERPLSSHLLRSQTEEDFSSGSVQTQFRFQEPVVPEDHITTNSPVHTRELSIVHVKWDSERKRRQGYFAQEEGAEKSPFRHYNKANCDFES